MSNPLTEKQEETVSLALELGYYDIPSKVTVEDLADEADVSHQAISERLNRAHRNLIRSMYDE